MKSTLVILGIAATLVFVGCDSDTNKKGAASAAPNSSTAVKTADVASAAVKDAEDACASYAKELQACIDKQQADAKEPFQKQLDDHNKAFKEASAPAKAQMQDGCVIGLSALKQACQ